MIEYMDAWMMAGRMDAWMMAGCMDYAWMYGWMYGCEDAWIGVICIYNNCISLPPA